jgi:hypothetical protein
MNTIGGQRPGGDVVGRLLLSAWRYKGLIAAVVLVGALLGYGWAARQPTRYQGVARVVLGPSPPVDVLPVGPVDPRQYPRQQAQLMHSAPVLERAVKLTGNRISAETLRQRLEVDAAKDADVRTIRVSTRPPRARPSWPTRCQPPAASFLPNNRARDPATWCANSATSRARSRQGWPRSTSNLPAGRTTLFSGRSLRPSQPQLSAVQRRLRQLRTAPERDHPMQLGERAAVPSSPSHRALVAMVTGMLVGSW